MDERARAEVALLLYCCMVSLVTVGSSATAVCLLLSAYCSQPWPTTESERLGGS